MLWIRLTFVIQVFGKLLDRLSEVKKLAWDVCQENKIKEEDGIEEEDIGDGGGYEGDSDDEGEKGAGQQNGLSKKQKEKGAGKQNEQSKKQKEKGAGKQNEQSKKRKTTA
jgi:hypothetical protein